LPELLLKSTISDIPVGLYFVSTNTNVDVTAAIWSDFRTSFAGSANPLTVVPVNIIKLVPKNPAENPAECAGTYTKDSSRTVNKIPIYVNADNTRVIFSNIDGKWSITAAFYLPSMITDTISPKK
jgi:hypothetical protein